MGCRWQMDYHSLLGRAQVAFHRVFCLELEQHEGDVVAGEEVEVLLLPFEGLGNGALVGVLVEGVGAVAVADEVDGAAEGLRGQLVAVVGPGVGLGLPLGGGLVDLVVEVLAVGEDQAAHEGAQGPVLGLLEAHLDGALGLVLLALLEHLVAADEAVLLGLAPALGGPALLEVGGQLLAVLLDEEDAAGHVVLLDVADGGGLPLLREVGLVDAALDLVVVLVVVVLHLHALHEVAPRDEVGVGELLGEGLQPHCPVREHPRVAVDVLAHLRLRRHRYRPHQLLVLAVVLPVHEHAHLPLLDDVDLLLPGHLLQPLVGGDRPLLQPAGHLVLEPPRPVAQEEHAGLEHAQAVLADDLGAQFVVELEEEAVLVLGLELVGHALVGDEVVLGLVLEGLVELVELAHLAHVADVPLEGLLLLAHLGEGVAHLVEQVAEADHPHYLDQHHHRHLAGVLGAQVAVPDRQDGRAGEVERVDVGVEHPRGLRRHRVHPAVLAVEPARREQQQCLSGGRGTKVCAWMRVLSSRSAILNWFWQASTDSLSRKRLQIDAALPHRIRQIPNQNRQSSGVKCVPPICRYSRQPPVIASRQNSRTQSSSTRSESSLNRATSHFRKPSPACTTTAAAQTCVVYETIWVWKQRWKVRVQMVRQFRTSRRRQKATCRGWMSSKGWSSMALGRSPSHFSLKAYCGLYWMGQFLPQQLFMLTFSTCCFRYISAFRNRRSIYQDSSASPASSPGWSKP